MASKKLTASQQRAKAEYDRLRRNYNRRVASWLKKGFAIKDTLPEWMPSFAEAKKRGTYTKYRKLAKRISTAKGYAPFRPSKAEAERRGLKEESGKYRDMNMTTLVDQVQTYDGMARNFADWLTREILTARQSRRYSQGAQLHYLYPGQTVSEYLDTLLAEITTGTNTARLQGRNIGLKEFGSIPDKYRVYRNAGIKLMELIALVRLYEQAQGTLSGAHLEEYIYGSAVHGEPQCYTALQEFVRVFRRETVMFGNI